MLLCYTETHVWLLGSFRFCSSADWLDMSPDPYIESSYRHQLCSRHNYVTTNTGCYTRGYYATILSSPFYLTEAKLPGCGVFWMTVYTSSMVMFALWKLAIGIAVFIYTVLGSLNLLSMCVAHQSKCQEVCTLIPKVWLGIWECISVLIVPSFTCSY